MPLSYLTKELQRLDKVEKVIPGGIIFYVAVEDIPKTLNKAEELGAKTVKGKTEIPNVGWFGSFSDLDGNIIGVFTAKRELLYGSPFFS